MGDRMPGSILILALIMSPAVAVAGGNCPERSLRCHDGLFWRASVGAGFAEGVFSVPQPDWGPWHEAVDLSISVEGASVSYGGEVGWVVWNGITLGVGIWGIGVPFPNTEEYDKDAFSGDYYDSGQDTLLSAWSGTITVVGPSVGVYIPGIEGVYINVAVGGNPVSGALGETEWSVGGTVGDEIWVLDQLRVGMACQVGYWKVRRSPGIGADGYDVYPSYLELMNYALMVTISGG
jgi:hypothetical protein